MGFRIYVYKNCGGLFTVGEEQCLFRKPENHDKTFICDSCQRRECKFSF